jgi:hypothetical protein
MKKLNVAYVQLLLSKWQMLYEYKKRLDFDNSQSMSDNEYQSFTSLSKSQFDDLIGRLSESMIRNSSNRSIRTAIAILLCKLRLGLSNQLLAILLNYLTKNQYREFLKAQDQH